MAAGQVGFVCLGLAHALGKPIIMIKQKNTGAVPFDGTWARYRRGSSMPSARCRNATASIRHRRVERRAVHRREPPATPAAPRRAETLKLSGR